MLKGKKQKGTKQYSISKDLHMELTLLVNGQEIARRQALFIDEGYEKGIKQLMGFIGNSLGLTDIPEGMTVDWSMAMKEGVVSVRPMTEEELKKLEERKAQIEKMKKDAAEGKSAGVSIGPEEKRPDA